MKKIRPTHILFSLGFVEIICLPRTGDIRRVFLANALYCSLRYVFDISSFFSSLVSPGEVCRRHHLLNVSTSLQAEVDVIKDMVMLERIKSSAYLLARK